MLDPVLLQIAKGAILNRLDGNYNLDLKSTVEHYPYLEKEGACFVTLHYKKQLRGCIGSIIAHRKLVDDIVSNAISAAFSDPRFSPLTIDEVDQLDIEVSVLTAPEMIEYSDYDDLLKQVIPHKDGLIIQHGRYQGTFLPQVWEELPSSEEFLEHLSYKAGANPSIYQYHPTLYRYHVEAIEESYNAILPL